MTARRKAQDNTPAALIPVNRAGEVIEGAGAVALSGNNDGEDWRMTVGGESAFDPADDGLSDVPQTAADRIATTLANAAGDDRAVVKVWRVLDGGKGMSWCKDYSPADYETGGLEMIRDTWGPGLFEVRVYGVHPTGKAGHPGFGMRASARITVEAAKNQPLGLPGGGMSNALEGTLRLMLEGQQAMLRQLQEQAAKTTAPVDPVAQMTQMFTMMKLMREATGESGKKSSIAEVVDAIRELKDVSGIINPTDKGDDDSVMGILKTMLPVVQTAIANRAPPPAVSFPQIAAPPSIANATPPEPQSIESEAMPKTPALNPEAVAALALRGYLAALLVMAQQSTPEADLIQQGAELIYEKLPDEIVDMLALDSWFTLLCQVEPGAARYQDWLMKVRDAALALFEAPDDDEAAPGAAG